MSDDITRLNVITTLSSFTGSEVPEDTMMHYGMPRRSGRYPWGSGDEPYQRNGDFISRVKELRKTGMSEQDIAVSVGCKNTSDLRSRYSIAANERRAFNVAKAKSMLEDGHSQADIARASGERESTVRSWLNASSERRMNEAQKTADFLRDQVDQKGMIDVGVGVERELGISRTKLMQALKILEQEGYNTYGGGVPQVTNAGKQTNIKVLCPPDIVPNEGKKSPSEIYDFENVHSVYDYRIRQDENGNDVVTPAFVYPKSMDSSRMMVRYAEEGGLQKDGVVEIRRGVDDLSLGESHYAQVRILVDDNKFIKGMAVHSDNLPDGVDLVFNTNKPLGTPKDKVLKDIKPDPDNPFGALIKEKGGQSYYTDENGKQQLRLINKTREEGDWNEWSNSLPSQFLSKQPLPLIRKQLNMAVADKRAELDEIMSRTNPTVKKELLKSFADDCDHTASHLQAAALPRQKYQVILPVDKLRDTEVYAPNFNDGETVALIRYPHGGTFEIPILTVNNKHPDARDMLGSNPADAIGINSKIAARLSGADFDGDTVMVIPCNSISSKVKILSTHALKDLEGFDPKVEYGSTRVVEDSTGTSHYYNGDREFSVMRNTPNEMGRISNLITDMTLKGATQPEIAKAVRHSMVVIDAEKHKLDYKQSERDNDIAALKKRYQARIDDDGSYHEGASTLISRAKSETAVLKRQGQPKINKIGEPWYDPNQPEGALIYKHVEEEYRVLKDVKDPVTGRKIVDPSTGRPVRIDTGKTKLRMEKVQLMSVTGDAHDLSSGTPQENEYADFANQMKALANTARKGILTAGKIEYNANSRITYQPEVSSLLAKLNVAKMNAPRERKAQMAANSVVDAKKADNPDMTKKELKKAGQMALTAARIRFGASRIPIKITDREWEAIQAGAISENVLSSIIKNTDIDDLRLRATPRAMTVLSPAKIAKINTMRISGYTNAQIAEDVGCSPSTVSKHLLGKE